MKCLSCLIRHPRECGDPASSSTPPWKGGAGGVASDSEPSVLPQGVAGGIEPPASPTTPNPSLGGRGAKVEREGR